MGLRWMAVAALALAIAPCALSPDARAAEWKYSMAPYFWAADLGLDLEINGDPVLDQEIDVSDLLSDLEAAFTVHVEMATDKGGFFMDTNWLSLTSKDERNLTGLPGETKFRSDVSMGIYELGAFYRPNASRRLVDLLFGIRVIDQKQDIKIQVGDGRETRSETEGSLTDAFVGLRAGGQIGGRWDLMVRGDVGTGDTELTWNAMGTVGYAFGSRKQFNTRFGWRQMTYRVKDSGTQTTTDSTTTMKGPILGLNWTF